MSDYGAIGLDEIIGAMDSDELLDELIAGDDDEGDATPAIGLREIIGQMAAQQNGLAQQAARMRQLRAIDPNAVEIQTQVDNRRRILVMGTEVVTVAAGATVQIEIKPQRLFRTERVSVPSSISTNFAITDCKIGQQSQFAATGVIHCDTISEVAINANVHFDTANVGNTITLTVTNLDAANPHDFYSTWFGTATVR